MSEQNELLIDKKGLLAMCPGLSRWGLEWLIRTRQIPIIRLGKKRIYFDPVEIRKWVDSNKIKITGDKIDD